MRIFSEKEDRAKRYSLSDLAQAPAEIEETTLALRNDFTLYPQLVDQKEGAQPKYFKVSRSTLEAGDKSRMMLRIIDVSDAVLYDQSKE